MLTAPLTIAVLYLATQHPVTPPDGASPVPRPGPAAPAPASETVVRMLKDGHGRFELLDTAGVLHKASLVQVNGDSVVLRSGNDVFTIPVEDLQRSHRRGDSPWDGALIGFSVGAGIWALVAQDDPASTWRWKSDNPDDWTVQDTISLLAFSTTVGYIVDALHVGKHTVFVGPMRSSGSKAGLQVGYRMVF